MTHDRKNSIFDEVFNSCLKLQYDKAKDYASDADALMNFKSQDAELLGLTPFQKWGVYYAKQSSSILNAIGNSPQMPSTTSEPIEERINDAIIYLVLLKCLLEDLKSNSIETTTLNDENNVALEGIVYESPRNRKNSNAKPIHIVKSKEPGFYSLILNDLEIDNIKKHGNIVLSSESNPFVLYFFKIIKIDSSSSIECILDSKKVWVFDKWKPYLIDKNDDINTNETWFLNSFS